MLVIYKQNNFTTFSSRKQPFQIPNVNKGLIFAAIVIPLFLVTMILLYEFGAGDILS